MIQPLLDEYISLRNMGVDANSALQPLRPKVEKLSESERAELVHRVREWERDHRDTPPPPMSAPAIDDEPSSLGIAPHGVIKKVKSQRSQRPQSPPTAELLPGTGSKAAANANRAVPPDPPPPAPTKLGMPKAPPVPVNVIQPMPVAPPAKPKPNPSSKTVQCPKCQRVSPSSEIFCPACGTFLQDSVAAFQTTRFEPEHEASTSDHFDAKMILVLIVRHNKNHYRIQPQNYAREIVVGRSDVGAPMTPDIDLANQGAGELGVSRMHVSIQYDAVNHTLSVTDMRSSNGSFINNQRLHPHEVRILRHGDELRLGRLSLGVTFQAGA